jgi:hypothetical protein
MDDVKLEDNRGCDYPDEIVAPCERDEARDALSRTRMLGLVLAMMLVALALLFAVYVAMWARP